MYACQFDPEMTDGSNSGLNGDAIGCVRFTAQSRRSKMPLIRVALRSKRGRDGQTSRSRPRITWQTDVIFHALSVGLSLAVICNIFTTLLIRKCLDTLLDYSPSLFSKQICSISVFFFENSLTEILFLDYRKFCSISTKSNGNNG